MKKLTRKRDLKAGKIADPEEFRKRISGGGGRRRANDNSVSDIRSGGFVVKNQIHKQTACGDTITDASLIVGTVCDIVELIDDVVKEHRSIMIELLVVNSSKATFQLGPGACRPNVRCGGPDDRLLCALRFALSACCFGWHVVR